MKIACALLCLTMPVAAQVKIARGADRISVEIDGKPFTDLHIGPETAKPFLWPLRAASGTVVTRRFPLEDAPGDSKDHPQHRGLMFGHADLNGYNYWANESFNPGKKGKIVLQKLLRVESGAKKGAIDAVFAWLDPRGETLLTETRIMTFYAHPKLRTMDFDIVVEAVQPVKFGDTHEGSFGVRVAAWLEEPAPAYVPAGSKGERRPTEPKRTGLISDAEGRQTEEKVRGKRANWADYSGEFQGEKLGIAIFDHPSNPRHPTYWHTRGYGMFAANIFGVSDFENDKKRDGSLALKPGEELRFRYRVVIHPGSAAEAGIAGMYAEYVK
jgi:Methane oxygenase PmoA